MLHFKIKELIEKKGKIKTYSYLTSQCKISSSVAVNLLNGKQKSINRKDISKICIAFNCTPNDLFYWDNSHDHLPESHPLVAVLKPPDNISNWSNILTSLPKESVEKLYEIAKNEMKNSMKKTNTI